MSQNHSYLGKAQTSWGHLVSGQVWGYTRKSTREEGGTNKSQESQGAAVVDACADLGLPFTEDRLLHEQRGLSGALWWEGGGGTGVEGDPTAKKKARPKMTELVKAIAAGECKAVMVWGINRLARHVGIMEAVIELMARHECLLFDRNGQIDIATPEGRNTVRATMTSAQFQRERAAVDAPRGIRTQRGKGKLVVPGNRVGFRGEGKASGIVHPVSEELAIVRRIFDLFVIGTAEQGPLSVQQIAQVLMDEGVRWMEDVGQYARRSVRRNGEFTIYPASLYAILRDCAYQGKQMHAKQEWACPAFLLGGEPAIPAWLYEAAQEKLGARRTHPKHKSRPFTRIVKCGICGVTMRINLTSDWRGGDRTKKVPALLRCGEMIGSDWKCPHRDLPVIHLPVLLDYTQEHLAPLLMGELTARSQAGERVDAANRKAGMCRELKEAEQRLSEELPKYLGKVSPDMLGAMEREARQQIEVLRNQLRSLEDESARMERLQASLQDFAAAPEAVQREVVERLFEWVAVIPSGNEPEHYNRGRVVFLTRWRTFHTALIYRKPKAKECRFHNIHEVHPATIGEMIGGIGEFPDPETFVKHLERAYSSANIPFDVNTVVPGYVEWKESKAQTPIFDID